MLGQSHNDFLGELPCAQVAAQIRRAKPEPQGLGSASDQFHHRDFTLECLLLIGEGRHEDPL